ncbi:MAG: DUF2752 domain-containing protein [Curvibacter sp.]|nr:MAG: DUF2752 domain-containing protein [Curvibacter sp.]
MSATAGFRRWTPGLLWLGAWPLAGGLSRALLQGESLTVCGFRALTGQPCPLCGGTHLVHALTQWDWAAAWQAQSGLLPLLLGGWLLWGWHALASTGRRPRGGALPRGLLWGATVFWLGEWAWRVGSSLAGVPAISP